MAQDVASVTYDATQVVPVPSWPARRVSVKLKASTTYPMGAILGRITATGQYGLYASGNVDGTQTAEAIMPRKAVTDASNGISYGTATVGQYGQVDQTVAVYIGGLFNSADLSGADVGYLTATGWRTMKGGSLVQLGS